MYSPTQFSHVIVSRIVARANPIAIRWVSTPTLLVFEPFVAVEGWVGAPVGRVFAEGEVAVEGGPGPVDHARDESVLERIDVDIVDAVFKVSVVADCVFVVPALPYAAFAFGATACGDGRLFAAVGEELTGKAFLDSCPA